jgi:hypothetical protein
VCNVKLGFVRNWCSNCAIKVRYSCNQHRSVNYLEEFPYRSTQSMIDDAKIGLTLNLDEFSHTAMPTGNLDDVLR